MAKIGNLKNLKIDPKKTDSKKAKEEAQATTNAETAKPVDTGTGSTTQAKQTSEPKNSASMQQLMDRMERLEAENKAFKEQLNPDKPDPRRVNNDPKKFSFKLRWGVPVLSYISKPKDPTKDLVFKNKYWQYEDNHVVVLSLADGDKVEVMYNDFGINYKVGEPMIARDHNNELIYNDTLPRVKVLKFETEQYGEIEVLPHCAN